MQNGEAMTAQLTTGRTNQKLRTRTAIVQAAAALMRTGGEVNMLEVAKAALVSEATAYRYFPDLASLLQEAMAGQLPTPEQALDGVADSSDPVERVAAAAEHLLRHILTVQGAVRAMIAATITRPATAAARRPGLRFGLIDHALAPLFEAGDGTAAAAAATAGAGAGGGGGGGGAGDDAAAAVLAQLRNDLAVVVSAEALFCLTDLCGLDPEDAVASAVRTATTLTRAAVSALAQG